MISKEGSVKNVSFVTRGLEALEIGVVILVIRVHK